MESFCKVVCTSFNGENKELRGEWKVILFLIKKVF